jgi:hypothetical protein
MASKITNTAQRGIAVDSGNLITIENSDVGNNSVSGPTSGCVILTATNSSVRNNYVHDCGGPGISWYAYNAGDSWNGSDISGNVVLRTVQTDHDLGAIYTNGLGAGPTAGTLIIQNNFVRDWGPSGSPAGNVEGIYLDDHSSNVIIRGNVIGPPTNAAGLLSTYNAALFYNAGGTVTNNKATGNIIDVGTRLVLAGSTSGQSETFSNNVIIGNWAGRTVPTYNGVGWDLGSGSNQFVKNNLYWNYGGGGVPSNGTPQGDLSPTTANPKLSGYLYNMDPTSPAFSPPVSFPGITGGWGPPGFVIPSSSNHSDP